MKINICMLLGIRHGERKGRVGPQIGIASYITNFGHDVAWIVSTEKAEKVKETVFNDVRIFIIPCRYRKGVLEVVTRALYAYRRMRFVFKKFKKGRYNMIFVRDGLFDGLLALYIKRRYKIPFVLEMSNPIEQTWEYYKLYSRHKCFWYFITKIEAYLTLYIMHKADLVLPTTRWMLEDFAKKGITKSKMMPFQNGIDLDRFSNANGSEIQDKYGLKDSKVVIYIGTMQRERHLEVLIHAFSKVKENKENAKLLMVGEGYDKTNLEKLATDLGIENDVIFTGQVYFDEVPNFIAAGDIGVSPIPPLDFYKLSSPIKMFEYMALGKPVVANDEIPEQEEVLEQSGGGILVEFEAESFANRIIKLLDNPKMSKDMGERGREWVVKYRSYEVLARRLEERYFDVLKTVKTTE